jgi:hypothetical protein
VGPGSRIGWVAALAAAAGFALASVPVASADVTLGSTAAVAGAHGIACGETPTVPIQAVNGGPSLYTVPAGGGKITQWRYATEDSGVDVTLLALRWADSELTVIGSDTEHIAQAPASGVATFVPSTPIDVRAGDTIGLYSTACLLYEGGAIPADEAVVFPGSTYSSVPAIGQQIPPTYFEDAAKLLLSATVIQPQDASVSVSAAPGRITAPGTSQLVFKVQNRGPATDPIHLIGTLPAGLTIRSVTAGADRCSATRHVVHCNVSHLGVGRSARVGILAAATAAGTYAIHVSVAATGGEADPTPANNSASTHLVVGRRRHH